ncbi:hypothetical protein PR002_g11780 [Phytophthora rubi]|uniref:EGF-like domain-containing protein n=1 Tax=Phytophthora rubi TaxID=129364 RepID=A0A6A3LY91_9STRA|nr:hypothetical protein PR002_g11780 [Phytophthora rubi]
MTITRAAPAQFDPNFACCGGCSSSKRADAYNEKLATGSLVFIWDIKLKTDPQPVCTLTFPYDPALNEQVGERRVRSGRLVGTSYPIDNDYDYLCCEQRGQCLALNEDASGKCQCVKRWGFTGDHCQDSVYDVAEAANAKVFPNATNLSSVDHLLPDLRTYLLSFDYDSAIASASTSDTSTGCGCRRRNPLAKPKIYSKLQKIVWGTFMTLFLLLSSAAALMTLFVLNNDIEPLATRVFALLNYTLPSNLSTFEANFLSPMAELIANGYKESNEESFFLADIQEHSLTDLELHIFLDNQSYAEDVIGKPVFDLIDPLTTYSVLYPTVNNDSVDCEYMNITQPSEVSRMTIGGETGCFKCKTCLTIVDLISDAKTSWRKNIFEVQIDMLTAKHQLADFSLARKTLTPAVQRFLDRMRLMFSDFDASNGRLTAGYDAIASEIQQVSLFGLYALCGMCGFALILALSAFAHGILTGQRKLGRTACFFSEITFLIAVVLIGVLYTMSVMAQDAIVVLQRLDENTYAFLPSTQSAEDVNRLLFDQNFVEATDMVETLAFSDTLRVPPHPTPATDDPDRFNFTALYDMPTLFALEKLTANSDQALVELFAWSEDFVKSHYDGLQVLVFSDSSTPYNGTLHQELLNSTIQKLMDPDGDGELVTANDLLTIQTVFNESWRGVSDEGASLNKDIQSEWLFVAQLYFQKQKLETYVATVSSFIAKIHPLLVKTQTMEDAEFQLKAPVEFVTDSIRASRLGDCNYNGNCAWFRAALNELFDLFQQIVLKAERAAIICAVSAVALLLSVLSTNAFTSRQRRVVVKVYSAN